MSTRRGFYRRLATSTHPVARTLRETRRALLNVSVPAPRVVVRPLYWLYQSMSITWGFFVRVFVSEPLFKAACAKHGKNLRTDRHIHWISGRGDIVVGDNVWLDGKLTIAFAARFTDRPMLEIGDNTSIGDRTVFAIGKRITIGSNCLLSGELSIMDSNGHVADPRARLAGAPPAPDEVRPVTIGNGVWIGKHSIVFPGVRIGDGSVVSAGSVVRGHVPSYAVVAGNPAKVMFRLKKPERSESTP